MYDDDDYGPDSTVSVEVGAIGLSLFALLAILSLVSAMKAVNIYSRRLFLSSALYSIMEIPLWMSFLILKDFSCQPAYAVHILAQAFFFVSLSFACFVLHDVVSTQLNASLTNYGVASNTSAFCSFLFNPKFLAISNLVFLGVAIFAAVECVKSQNLFYFFHHSLAFEFFNVFDGGKNVTMTLLLLSYGFTLRGQLKNLLKGFDRSNERDKTVMQDLINDAVMAQLKASIQRLVLLMLLCFSCFLLRTAMIIIQFIYVERNVTYTLGSWLPLYGLLWFTLDDFIPRCGPLLGFFFFFGMRRVISHVGRDPKDEYGDRDSLAKRTSSRTDSSFIENDRLESASEDIRGTFEIQLNRSDISNEIFFGSFRHADSSLSQPVQNPLSAANSQSAPSPSPGPSPSLRQDRTRSVSVLSLGSIFSLYKKGVLKSDLEVDNSDDAIHRKSSVF